MTALVRHFLLFSVLGTLSLGADPVASVPSDMENAFGEEASARLDAPKVEWRAGRETVVWVDRTDDTNSRLMEFDPETGSRRMVLDEHHLTAVWGDRSGEVPTLEDPVWRPDGAAMLIANGEDLFLFDFAAETLTLLNTGVGVERHALFSPDGRRIAWVRENNLWVYDLESETEIGLTDDGSETVFNGVLDWVYEEEFSGREGRAFEWSATGSAIVWLRLDDGEIPIYHLVDLMGTHSTITRQRYPCPGDPSPKPSLHVIRFGESSAMGTTNEIVFGEPVPYIPRFGFTPGGDLWYQILDRAQENLRLVVIDATTGAETVLVEESDPFWTEPVDGLRFFDDGSLLWLSRRGGHTHLLRFQSDGTFVDLSPGPWDVTELVGVSPDARSAWYQAARPDATQRRLYRVDVDTGDTVELTSTSGTHTADLGTSGTKLLVSSSSVASPTRRRVVDSLGSNAAEVPVEHPIPRIDYADHRFGEITDDDGITFNTMLLFPPGFDESKKHPVVIYTYGGPHAQVVRDVWPRTSGIFNHILAGRGFVVFALDNRGSAARGREFEGATDHALGSKQLPDQLAGVEWLHSQPWVDPDRIGIWGWSYGGYMTIYALTHAPGVFAAGAAVAPVTDWRLYDSVYTERYMGTPEANPEGYAAGSVLDDIAKLADPLLVIHGTGDDNVHLQHTLQLADQAWRAGVRFDLMLFPNLTHGINAPGSHLQVFSAIADFFEKHLMETEAKEDR